MMNVTRTRPPFTATQWQELENQALIYKHMVSNVPIPPELLFPIKRSCWDSTSSKLFPHQSMGWGCFHMGLGRKIDPEPGRCRRTDGKKWRCSKEAFPDSKYCEKHMHRGRNRSRKPVEIISTATTTNQTTKPISSSFTTTSNNNNVDHQTHYHNHNHNHPYYNPSLPSFLYPHSSTSSSRPPGLAFSPQNHTTTHFVSDSGSYSHQSDHQNNYRCVHGLKEGLDERSFFTEPSGSLRTVPQDDSWKFTPLRMSSTSSSTTSSSSSTTTYNQPNGYNSQSQLQYSDQQNKHPQHQQQHCFVLGTDFKSERSIVKVEKQEEPQQPLRHFFDEWPLKSRESSWMSLEEERLNRSNSFSTTQLSISIPDPPHPSSSSSDFAAVSYLKW